MAYKKEHCRFELKKKKKKRKNQSIHPQTAPSGLAFAPRTWWVLAPSGGGSVDGQLDARRSTCRAQKNHLGWNKSVSTGV